MDIEIIPLTQADVKPKLGRPPGAVGKIRERHHTIAKMAGAGFTPAEIARTIGMTPNGVRLWIDNEANADLVASYAGAYAERADAMIDRRLALMNEAAVIALVKLKEQLLEDIEAGIPIPYDKLVKIAGHLDDRTGLGKQETKVNLNMDLGARLDKARERTRGLEEARSAGKVVDFVRRA